MGKRLFQEIYASQDRTDALGLPELMVVSEQDDKETLEKVYHAVHRSYFDKAKAPCPYCAGSNTTETKIRPRKYKDILPSKDGKTGVIDLIFHQRYFRCDDCNRVFHEDIDFSEEGCRYTNRLSDLLADGTLTKTYEKVCKDYGVPASKASVGVIMRRRLRMRIEQLPPLKTPEALVIFVAYYYSDAYPIVLGLYNSGVRLIDVLCESSTSAYAVFFNQLDRDAVKQIYIDPDEQLLTSVHSAFPNAKIMLSEECLKRCIRDAFTDIIKKDAARCFLTQRDHTLCKPEGYLTDFEHRQVSGLLAERHRLAAAYNAYQDLLARMESGWTIPLISGWIDSLPDYVRDVTADGEKLDAIWEFDVLSELIRVYEAPLNEYIALPEKPPATMETAVTSILDAVRIMPYCIYDILHARMLLNVEHDRIDENGTIYRIGVPVERLTRTMYEITRQIRKRKADEEYGYRSED